MYMWCYNITYIYITHVTTHKYPLEPSRFPRYTHELVFTNGIYVHITLEIYVYL